MRILLLAATLLYAPLTYGQTCHYGQGEKGIDADLKALRAEHTCQSAYALYERCLWGSSADPPRADIVQQKCTSALGSKLTPTQKSTLHDKLELCSLEFSGAGGTLSLSERSTCYLQVYLDFATDTTKASQPVPRASFDCKRAQSPLKNIVCSDRELGRYDLLLAKAYKAFLVELQATAKPALVTSQRAWIAATPDACSVDTPQAATGTLNCLRKRYRERMQSLDGCGVGADIGCLDTSAEP